MSLIEFIGILQSVYSNDVCLEVYSRCPCCGKDGCSTILDLYNNDFQFKFMNSKVLKVYYHEDKLEIEVEPFSGEYNEI